MRPGALKGQTKSVIFAEAMASSTLRPMGGVGVRVMPPLPLGLGTYRSLMVWSNSYRAWYAVVNAGTNFQIVYGSGHETEAVLIPGFAIKIAKPGNKTASASWPDPCSFWTASTDIPPKERHWPTCTNWRLGCCRMYQVPVLTHWGRDRMASIFQTTFSNTFSWMKMYKFRLRFHWSLFPRVQFTICQHWFR